MSSLFITVLNMSLTASYVALAVIIVRLLLRKAPKIFSYALWGVVLFRLVCPVSFESALSLMPGKTEAVSYDIIYSRGLSVGTGIESAGDIANQSIQPSLPTVETPASVSPLGVVIEIGAFIWLLGIIGLLGYSAVSYLRLKKRVSTATLVRDNIFETDRIQTPFVMGFIKPRIFIPVGFGPKELDYILKHEQIHIKRRDYLIKPFAFLAVVMHWFNPLIWLCYSLMSKDMEMSCDESVIKQSTGDIRINYSNSLLSLAAKQSGPLSLLAFGESNVKSRVKNVLNYKKPGFWFIILGIVVVAALAVGLMANPHDHVVYENDKYGFSVMLPKDFKENVEIREENNVVRFLNKQIQDMYPHMGGVGRIEIYDKNEVSKLDLKGLEDMYGFRYLGQNENYYFGWAHATDVQVPPNASEHLIKNFRAMESEFDNIIKTFEIRNGFNEEVVKLVEGFGSQLKNVSLTAPEEVIANDIKEDYSDYISPTLIEKWINDPQKAPGRLVSSPWPECIEIISIEKLSKDSYHVKGKIIEMSSTGIGESRPIYLEVNKIKDKWLINRFDYQNTSTSELGGVDGPTKIIASIPDREVVLSASEKDGMYQDFILKVKELF